MSSAINRVIVSGASGRTGSRVCALALLDDSFELVGALVSARSPWLGKAVPGSAERGKPLYFQHETGEHADVVIDFSSDDGARSALALALSRGAGALLATTALSAQTRAEVDRAILKIPVLVAPNTSLGVAAVADAAARLARSLGPSFTASIVETHHARKADAPSGTALRIGRAVREAGGALSDANIVAVRTADVVGEHVLRFTSASETVELSHRAHSRDVFAAGALRAAAWLKGRAAGAWTMEDVLGIARAGR